MLRHALRRLLWIGPILIAVTLTSFALLSYVPDPAEDPAVVTTLSGEQAVELRRTRFLDLPRFFNERPLDVIARVDLALRHLGKDDEEAAEAARSLVRLGGAALPHVLPRLDTLEPAARGGVAVALAPVAERMGIPSIEARDPRHAVAFWVRFWTDRSVDFRAANARRATRRLSLHGTSMRVADLQELDTFALEQIMLVLEELAPPKGTATPQETMPEDGRLAAIRRLVGAAAHATGRDDQLAEKSSESEAIACVRRWREWWLVHQADYTTYGGASRFLAMLTDTQYARWAEKVVLLGFGAGAEGTTIVDKLKNRAIPTLTIVTIALLLAYGSALALGTAAAVRKSSREEMLILVAAFALFAVPTACLATWAVRRGGVGLGLASLVLALSMIASPFAQGRALLREIERADYIRTARALGAGPLRVVVLHAMRNALLPAVALASVEMPTALGGAFVVEKVFGISGLGEETVRAVQTHDVAWLVGLAFVTALTVTIGSIATDVAIAAIDPRLSLAALRHGRVTA
ncbi:MAG TPA: ABC transporter permease [Polyangiaceae bacterium]|nr:ABC transporter permease [Polyangiaceae bacterium]